MATTTAAKKKRTKSSRQDQHRFLMSLSRSDRKLYEAIPEKIDYVPHPDYRLKRTEPELFGPEAETVRVAQWRHFPEVHEEETVSPKARPQLTREQEVLLFKRYNYARYRLAILVPAQAKRFSRRRVPEMLLWYRRALRGRADLASANMALVVAMGKRTRINTVEFAELVSEGNMALLRAIDKFDVSRGYKFSTYACRAILKAFSRLATKTGNYRQHFPTEFVPEMERSDEIDRRHQHQRELAIEDLQRVISRNLADLTDVERQVVGARFAVDGHKQVGTLEEVGRMVGLSKERVRQVQNGALAKLRAVLSEVPG
ncbi:MAG: sigma-70 family RNA polymerase sigma factor [Planctomycetota bacterium]|jgi:RNA polymerase sigma factor (sigma-70 family)